MLKRYKANKFNNGLIQYFYNFSLGPLFGIFISLFTVPVTTKLISPEEFGKSSLFSLAIDILTIITLLGMDQSFIRYYNEKINKEKLLYNAFFIPFCFVVLLMLLITLFNKRLSNLLFDNYEPFIMILLVFLLPCMIINRFGMIIIRMELKGKLYSLLNIFNQIIIFFCLIVFLFFYEKSFRSIVFSNIISLFINTIIIIILTKNKLTLSLHLFDKRLSAEFLFYGFPLCINLIIFFVFNSFDRFGLRQWSSYEQLGLYTVAFKFVALLNIIHNIFNVTWIPLANKWYADNENKKKFDAVSCFVLSIMSSVFVVIVIFRDIIKLFVGTEYRNVPEIMIYLLFIPIISTVSTASTMGIEYSKKTVYSLLSTMFCIFLNIFGNYFLIPQLGAKGAAISTASSYIVYFIFRTYFSRKFWYKFSLTKYIVNGLLLIMFVVIFEFRLPKYIEVISALIIFVVNILFIKENKDILKEIL
jgi:O-antigen/teichoic acid export membrane protein